MVKVIALSPNKGLVFLTHQNENTRVIVNRTVSSPNTLALQSVEWIVEDAWITFEDAAHDGYLAPLANWTTVDFFDSWSTITNGTNEKAGPAGTGDGVYLISENSTLLSSVTLDAIGGEIWVKCV